jgi:hypothetical protein
MTSTPYPRRRLAAALTSLIAAAAVALIVSGSRPGEAATGHPHQHAVAAKTSKQAALHDGMRKLWEDHITWTRLAIVSFAGVLPDLPATQARLLRNQVAIGNAIKPYYGKTAGNELTRLLKEHITGAVALLQAAKGGDAGQIDTAKTAWYRNGNEIADFLAHANPANWPRRTMRSMMKTHLDQTLKEAVDRLGGKYAADVRDYDAVHHHILAMADALSSGIVKQFPRRFR